MKLFFSAIGRFIVICIALFAAILAGSLFIGYGLANNLFSELLTDSGTTVFQDKEMDRQLLMGTSFLLGIITSFQLWWQILLPATIVIATSELMRWQSLPVNLILGGVCALFILFSNIELPPGQMPENGTIIVALAAGFIGSFFYWLIAGRKAGEWLGSIGINMEPKTNLSPQADNK